MNTYVVKTLQVSSKNMETWVKKLIKFLSLINPLNTELNPICQ